MAMSDNALELLRMGVKIGGYLRPGPVSLERQDRIGRVKACVFLHHEEIVIEEGFLLQQVNGAVIVVVIAVFLVIDNEAIVNNCFEEPVKGIVVRHKQLT